MTAVNPGQGKSDSASTNILRRQDIALAVGAFVAADRAAREGNENAAKEKLEHLRTLQKRYWQMFYTVLSATVAKRHSQLDFADDERLFMDLGLVDPRMLGPGGNLRALTGEIKSKSLSGCFYLSEWLGERYHQFQLESDLSVVDDNEEDKYASQLGEARRRVLSRLSDYLTGLPGVPLELSEAFRSGDMDKVVIAAGINCLAHPTRKNFLRRRQLWTMREQVLTKARARASSQNALRLFELLNEVYASDWRARFENRQLEGADAPARATAAAKDPSASVSVSDPKMDAMMGEARQMRMRMTLMGVIDGKEEPDTVLHGAAPRLTKEALAEFLPLAQTFDRTLAEMPPIIIVPGSGRGFFAWEAGCLLLALRPLVGPDDSLATALAWQRMLEDRFSKGGALRDAYGKAFPGAAFEHDFPAEYRAWLCRLTRGDVSAMQPEKRTFFRDFIGPDLSGPMLPANLRNVGPQTMVAICRRLEKQVAAAAGDVNLHRRLAAIYWQSGEVEAAGLQFNAAMQLAPNDGETLFSAGMFMRGQGDGEAANDCFRFGVERAADSMWGVYCRDALANMI